MRLVTGNAGNTRYQFFWLICVVLLFLFCFKQVVICLRIERILNNNIVSAIDEDAQELLILGKGLGFNSKVGDPINESKIEKVFELKDDTMDKFKMIVNEIPIQFLEVTDDIVKLFKMKTTKDISDVIYISLSDHLYLPRNVCKKTWLSKIRSRGK